MPAWPLYGHASAEAEFLSARAGGKLHHGWLIEGPSGIGKAQLVKRIVADMLGAASPEGTLDCPLDDPIAQKLLADAHPDLRWLSRRPDEKGKLKQDIPADEVRALNQFFSLKPALGGWRVGVIDSIDELNRFGANAILKTLEEPPSECLLILVSHRTRPVLPTIRSRCRSLQLSPLNAEDTRAALDDSGHENSKESTVLSLARGRPGHGLKLASSSGIAAANATRSFLRGWPKPSDAALGDLIIRAGADEIAFEAFSGETLSWLAEKATDEPRFATTWLKAAELIGKVAALNMDRVQATSALIAGLPKPAQTP